MDVILEKWHMKLSENEWQTLIIHWTAVHNLTFSPRLAQLTVLVVFFSTMALWQLELSAE
jgi:hypothetical protein